MNINYRRLAKILLVLLFLPIGLFLLLAVLLYIPAVQDAAVREATRQLSSTLAMDVSVDRVRLSFPRTFHNVKFYGGLKGHGNVLWDFFR